VRSRWTKAARGPDDAAHGASAKYLIEGRLRPRRPDDPAAAVEASADADSFSPEEIAEVEALADQAARALVQMRESEGRQSRATSPRIALRQKATVLKAVARRSPATATALRSGCGRFS
jgi:hypothetical protein